MHQHQPSQTAIELSKITQGWGETLGEISGLEKRVARESAEYASLIRVLDKQLGKSDVQTPKEPPSEVNSSQASSSSKVQLSLA